MFTFGLKGGYDAGVKLVSNVKLFSHLANIGDTRSLIIHPASTTHRQLSDAQKVAGRRRPRRGAAVDRARGQGRHHRRPRAGAGGGVMAEPTHVTLATATPGGGFPFFGDNAAAVINETDKSLLVETKNTKGSAENIGLLEAGTVDIALVAGEPAYEAFSGIGRAPTKLQDHPGDLFQPRHVRGARRQPGEEPARSHRQADRLGHAGVGADAARALRHRRARPRPREGFPAALSGKGRRRPADGGRRPGRGAVGRRHRLAGLHRGDAGRRALHRAHRRRGGEGQRQAQFPQTHHRAGRRLSGPEGAGEFGRLVELHPGADRPARRRRLSARQGAARRPCRAGEAARSGRARPRRRAPPTRRRAPGQIHPGVQKYLREVGVLR